MLPILAFSALLASFAPQSWTSEPMPRPTRIAPRLIEVVDHSPYKPLAGDGRWLLVFQDESSLDLNGDGDTIDHVLAVHDLFAGTTTSLGLAHRLFEPVVLAGGRGLILVPEFEQGADLNGDGDIADRVWFAVDLASANATSSGLAGAAGGPVPIPGLLVDRWAVLPVLESAQGQSDLDASGTIGGSVLFSWDLVAATSPVSLLHAVEGVTLVAHESFLLAKVSENFYGGSDPRSDLNGDGDPFDRVLLVFDLNTSIPVNTQLASVGTIQAAGGHSAFSVSEGTDQADLNGDGDTLDSVLYLFDSHTGVLQNLGLALQGGFVNLGHGGAFAKEFQLTEDALVFAVGEGKQGNTDLNGDGDHLDSGVLFVHDFATGTTQNLGLSAFEFVEKDGLLCFQVSEQHQGVDLDGNGDLFDHVAHAYRLSDGSTWNLGLKTTPAIGFAPFAIEGPWIALDVPEAQEDDWNGDGDQNDLVLFTADTLTEQTFNHGLAIAQHKFLFTPGGALSFLASESAQGADLDGNGVATDLVFHLLRLQDGRMANSRTRSDGFLLPGIPHRYPISTDEGFLRVARSRL